MRVDSAWTPERIFHGLRSRSLDTIVKTAYRRLAILHSARTLHDLKSPGLQFEALKDDRAGQHSIRINDRYRVCFEWQEGEAGNVEIVDYHLKENCNDHEATTSRRNH